MNDRASRTELDVDPFDEAVLVDPTEVHAAIREAAPVVWVPRYEAWFVGRDDLVREVFRDWRRFSSAYGVGLPNLKHECAWQKPSVIVEVDPPDHSVTRGVLNRMLSPRAVRELTPEFERVANEFVDELIERRALTRVSALRSVTVETRTPGHCEGHAVSGRSQLAYAFARELRRLR